MLLISLALCADAVIGNVQEKAMKLHNGSNSEMVSVHYFSIIKSSPDPATYPCFFQRSFSFTRMERANTNFITWMLVLYYAPFIIEHIGGFRCGS